MTVSIVNPDKHIGAVGGHIRLISASAMQRPATTPTYASGQLVANHATAGNVVPFQFIVAREPNRGFMLRRAHLKKSSTGITNAQFRLHLYRNLPTLSNGDTGAWLTTESKWMGGFDIPMDKVFTDAAKGNGFPLVGGEISGYPDDDTQVIYGLLEARAAYVGVSAETFTPTLEVHQD